MPETSQSTEAIVVVGSLYWNTFVAGDVSFLKRSEVHPLQILTDGNLHPIGRFDDWGRLGVSALALNPLDPNQFFITTGERLHSVRFEGGWTTKELLTPPLRDVHEITLIDSSLWLANTGYDEIIALDTRANTAHKRIDLFELTGYRRGNGHFHVNQVLRDLGGRMVALVHNISARHLGTRLERKIRRKPGEGGVIDLETGQQWKLWLRAPHTVRVVNGNYWVCESGMRRISVYDKQWRLQRHLETPGFGRGGTLSSGGCYYTGVTRWKFSNHFAPTQTCIRRYQPSTYTCTDTWLVDTGIEQINNLYTIPRSIAVDWLA